MKCISYILFKGVFTLTYIMVNISYAICVCNEHRELKCLINFLLKVKDEGDEVNIHFENGEIMKGHIRKIYPTAFTQPVEIKKRFGSINRYLIAEIEPESEIALDRVLETKVDVMLRRKWL